MTDAVISIARNFSRFPGGRFRTDGPHSGQQFREELLLPALRRGGVVTVSLDDVAGLPASFLEEAFGGLVRAGVSKSDLRNRLRVSVTMPRLKRYPLQISDYIEGATEELARAC